MTIDSQNFRKALGCLPTGIAVISAVDAEGAPVGVTVGSFTSLSLDPPLILFCLDSANVDLGAFAGGGAFVVNILGEDQRDLSMRFGSRQGEKWKGLDFETEEGGLPVLKGCLATLVCTTADIVDGGDHKIFIGRVERLTCSGEGRPLVYFRGAYARLAASES